MTKRLDQIAAGVFLALNSGMSWAQFDVLPATESMRVVQDVARSLALLPDDAQRVLEAALPWDACLAHWNAQKDSLESADIGEEVSRSRVDGVHARDAEGSSVLAWSAMQRGTVGPGCSFCC